MRLHVRVAYALFFYIYKKKLSFQMLASGVRIQITVPMYERHHAGKREREELARKSLIPNMFPGGPT